MQNNVFAAAARSPSDLYKDHQPYMGCPFTPTMGSPPAMDRKTLIETLEKHLQRDKTISILEGRDKRRKERANGRGGDGHDSDSTVDEEETPTKAGSLRRRAASSMKRSKSTKTRDAQRASEAQGGRTSQFMDADEAIVQEQIQQQLAQGVKIVSAYHLLRLT